jgi:MFS family permease
MIVQTDVPARLDRLPWMRWHWLIVLSLGTTWILDGLEVTIVGAIGSALQEKDTLALTAAQIGTAASAYIGGAIGGALVFGHLTDRLGRKRLFLWTLALYVAATLLTASSWSFASFVIFRFLTGTAIGGEYAAINSAIDELLPARVRGFADLAINGSYWIGTAAGAAASTVLLDRAFFPGWLGWRLAFGIGAMLAFAVVLVRRHVPESPRWLVLHGRTNEADAIVRSVEAMARTELAPVDRTLRIHAGHRIGFRTVAKTIFGRHRGRALLGLSLMVSQAFFYNAIFFTYALVLTRFYGVPNDRVGWYILPFAAGNFFGPLLLGRLFDAVGRRPMIALTYGVSGVLLLVTGWLFSIGALSATSQTLCWSVVFFFASAAASSAYLTVSELFPVELRALSIALFYAIGTGAGGIAAPALFGALIDTGDRRQVLIGYAIGGALMILAAISALILGVSAERKSLEEIAEPISSATH